MKYTKPTVDTYNTNIEPRGNCPTSFSCGGWFESFDCNSKHKCSGKKFSCQQYN